MATHSVEYNIQTLPKESNSPQSYVNIVSQWTPNIAKAARIATTVYLLVRLSFLSVLKSTWWMWAIFYMECAIAHEYNQNQSIAIATRKYGDPNLGRHRERLRLMNSSDNKKDLPLVDILIPCCGETLEVILDTVRGACQVDYPVDRFRILLLDDGQSSELQNRIQHLQNNWKNLHYHCRGESNRSQLAFGKAGNLNYALFNIQEAMNSPPEFIAVLDADFIPSPHFLRATLPHLLCCPKLAIAGASQDFYNLPAGDPMIQSLDNWQRRLIPHLNQLGCCFHAHSGSVIRRSVLIEHKGFPTISFGEDVLLSNVLLGTGSQIIALPEMLQLGRCPESLEGHVAQRSRWGIGLCQMILALRSSPNNAIAPDLRWGIAKQGIIILLTLANRVFMQLVIPLAFFSGQMLVPASSSTHVKVQGVLAIVSLGLTWLFEWSLTAKSGYGGPPFGDLEEIWLAHSYLTAVFRYCFFKRNSGTSLVTGSTLNPWNSEAKGRRIARLKTELWNGGAVVNMLSFGAMAASMVYAATYNQDRYVNLIFSVAWPSLLNLCYLVISSNWTPLACAFSPPSWTNSVTLAMKTGEMDSHTMFSQPELQRTLRPLRRPLGHANHQALVPLIFIGLFLAILRV